MPVKFTIKYDQREVTRIKAKIEGIAKGDWMSRALLESAQYMLMSTRKEVIKGIDIEDRPFEPLTDRYVNSPLKSGGRGGIRHPFLIRPAGSKMGKYGAPGQMINSLVVSDVKKNLFGGASIVVKPGDSTMQELGSFHQSPKPGSSMPRRAWLGFRSGDSKRIHSIFRAHLQATMGKK